jgi:hypothetical protein
VHLAGVKKMNENQKKTTEEYRSNWDNIFKKKQDDKPKEQETKPSPGN